ncbi:HAMP domain-containing protein [Heliobacillus mobilis]|uniref:HAMP domain-containing protein n=1 Tax=Heliobacterium mobile TaxID=28064 RepID=A0A6I3SK42_HELMO|nr:methyl-accepting chemotaxis protein [Heliobacterium mobile]MTV49269.1 HAMP domain-containing protein [Heliobacterium mobile]
MLKDLKIGTRIMIVVAFLLLVMSTIGIIGISVFKETHDLSTSTLGKTNDLIQMVDSSRNVQVLFKKQVQEWKNILLRGHDPAAFQKYLNNFQKEETETDNELKYLKELLVSHNIDASKMDQALTTHRQLGEKYREALHGKNLSDPETVRSIDHIVNGIDRVPTDDIDSLVMQIEDYSKTEYSSVKSILDEELYNFQKIIISTLLFSLIAGGLIGWFFIQQITRPLILLKNKIAGIAESDGDLTQQIDITSRDEIGIMADKFNLLLNKTRNTIEAAASGAVTLNKKAEDLSSTTEEVYQSSQQIAQAVETLARGNQDIANEISQIRGSLNTINGNARTTSEEVKRILDEFTEVGHTLDNGQLVLMNQKTEVDNTMRLTHQVAETVNQLKEKTQAITQIAEIINNIAAQTNLLALNAAIEAARAGDQGRGFAVVAEEVRKLAESSSQSTQQVFIQIKEIEQVVTQTAAGIQQANQGIYKQAQVSEQTEQSFYQITEKVNAVMKDTRESGKRMLEVIQQVESLFSSTNLITSVANDAAASTEQVTASVEEQTSVFKNVAIIADEFRGLAENLRDTVNRFKY